MEIASTLTTLLSSKPFFVAAIITALCLLLALHAIRSLLFPYLRTPKLDRRDSSAFAKKVCNCVCSCNGGYGNPDSVVTGAPYVNGGTEEMVEKASVAVAERLTGASMMEQLVPEITTHALSYLDYPSLCRLSMTNSLMRKAANDDNAWKALYHKVIIFVIAMKKILDDICVSTKYCWLKFEASTYYIWFLRRMVDLLKQLGIPVAKEILTLQLLLCLGKFECGCLWWV